MKYREIYPLAALLRSEERVRALAADLMTLDYFEAEPGEMPAKIFTEHHILLNLREEPHRVENWRNGEHRDFIYRPNEIIITPAGIKSGWRWHGCSKVIVITLDPLKFQRFAAIELGISLTAPQLKDIPQALDQDLTFAGSQALEALQNPISTSVMYESFARVFLIRLITGYGIQVLGGEFTQRFSAERYKRVLDYIALHFGEEIRLEDLASEAGLSPYYFARVFRQTIGESPHRFVMTYRIEQSKKMLTDPQKTLSDIAFHCGFADQAHFSGLFKQQTGETPKQFRLKNTAK